MSNVLQFKSFHERHFSPEQVKYWQQHILNQQQQQQQHSTWQWQQYNESYPSYNDNDPTILANEETYTQEEEIDINMEQEPNVDQHQQTSLSQEAIEIFKFSEAYRKERKWS
ncbi:hypothetical protein BDC45DRAFT_437190 [Circinella umbellata]|nr:hypothetical protein BDC45DRAFT_437190 [Circinella umbellata]